MNRWIRSLAVVAMLGSSAVWAAEGAAKQGGAAPGAKVEREPSAAGDRAERQQPPGAQHDRHMGDRGGHMHGHMQKGDHEHGCACRCNHHDDHQPQR